MLIGLASTFIYNCIGFFIFGVIVIPKLIIGISLFLTICTYSLYMSMRIDVISTEVSKILSMNKISLTMEYIF